MAGRPSFLPKEIVMSIRAGIFYIPSTRTKVNNAIDVAMKSDGRIIGVYTSKTLEELAEQYPGVVLGTEQEYEKQIVEAVRTAPVEITEEAYWEALEVLPPVDWQARKGNDSFKLSEFITLNVTSIYANRGARYYKFRDVATLTHRQIMSRLPIESH
jgi:hypothetical protein